ncbi:hypothetical protein [Faecalimicrobium dakarense]|uniref:hypothetical protein n=1 Tax=Faecalimicrobium dakarense TaxID=1301100 RepID=UPI0004B818A4|nr:hypothetical protein [[Clostridium] dakarense]
MNIKNNCRVENVSKYLIENFNAIEITIDEFLEKNKDIYEDAFEDIAIIFKIEDENIIKNLLSENEKAEIEITIDHLIKNNQINDVSSYMNEISTGKLIIILLESKDKTNLSGFVMEGNGEVLFDYLTSLIYESIEKALNPLDEVIEEFSHFRPYGKYFK